MEYEEYLQIFRESGKSSPTGDEYIESLGVSVDSQIAPLIRVIDEESRFQTESSCSGALCDHFELDELQERGVSVCDDPEFVLAFESVALSEVSVAIVDEWHQIQRDGRDPPLDSDVYVDGEFYDLKDAFESIMVEYDDSTYGYPIHVEYSRKMIPQWVRVTVNLPVRMWIREVDSFEEFDERVASLIVMLTDVFSDVDGLVRGEWDSLRYDVSGRYWYEAEREFGSSE